MVARFVSVVLTPRHSRLPSRNEIAICGNAGTLQLLQFQDLGQERWEGECIELYISHSNNARETSDPNEISPSPTSQLSRSQARLARRQGVLIG